MAIKILTDSTSYINDSIKKLLDIRTISLRVEFPDKTFKETDLNNTSFYEMMEEKGIPKSSQPSIGELYTEMENVIKPGDDLVCILLSSEMSGTYATTHMAKDMILKNYPNANIEIIDSRSNCMQLGFAAIEAAKAAKDNESLEQVINAANENIKKSRFLFIPDNLKYLEKGGRIGKANAIIGNLLKIIPILTVENGVTTIFKKVRTKKKAVITIVEQVLEDIKNYGLGEVVVHHINCFDEAENIVNEIKKFIDVDIKIQDIGPVIGLHVGPGAIGVAYYTKKYIR
ncbi:DegV family protein [Alkaliphilus peptidifermentans]|uniref:EDD domain protein, DegV family n=1 Tax=Alkaliphilus peptidifermentans DSM 18978 TaxID=1120976 RepID=A0A1G5EY61_9FIRM|nr:DegV family protein [Alkaliphilus peptidifermentans]SCY31923.1 EDD domain protein, DegV family [Alkaliphilus peptidifermentans DSM 18978]